MAKHSWLAVVLLAAGIALPAQSVPPDPGGPPPAPQMQGGENMAQRRETMHLYLVYRMRQTLQLTDAQSLKVMAVLDDMDKLRRDHMEKARALLERLNDLANNDKAGDKAILAAVAEFRKEQAAFMKKLEALDGKMLDVMSPRQQAQWLVFRRELTHERRGGRRGPGTMRRPGGGPGPNRLP
ncbi:MAG: periplasmic heavy metal sensor [Acidobacteriota bacterium]|jgi:Spy/CpxP family protein refolding chaperone